MTSKPIACDECAAQTARLIDDGCKVFGCEPIAGQPGMCLIRYERPAFAGAGAGAPATVALKRMGTRSVPPPPPASAAPAPGPRFAGRPVKEGEADAQKVRLIQDGLARLGYGPFTPGVFDAAMTSIVKLFQAQHSDVDGAPLLVDGEVGRLSWSVLFPQPSVFPASASSTLMLHAVAVAGTQIGQMEVPPGSNRGPMVDVYLDAVGIPPSMGNASQRFWCMAFVYWTFKTAAASLGVQNPLPRTAGCVDHWNRAKTIPGAQRIKRADAFADASLVKPGQIAILDFGGGAGHTFIVERLLDSGRLVSLEGNTNSTGSSNGVGVFRLERRKLSDAAIVGFVDYSNATA